MGAGRRFAVMEAMGRSSSEGAYRGMVGYLERLTLLPPPPDVPIADQRVPRDHAPWVPDIAAEEEDTEDTGDLDLREPTDPDGTPWWEDDEDEDSLITLRPPRFQQTH